MLKNISLLFLVLISTVLYGEQSSETDKVLLKNGTIIKGDITFTDNYKTPNFLKISNGKENLSFEAYEVVSFEFNKTKYISKFIEIDQTDQYLNSITTSVNEKSVEKDIFLRLVVEGETSLYIYKDSRSHYFVTKDSDFIELIRIPRYLDNGKSKPYNKYIGQLTILLSDCLSQEKINEVAYSYSAIKKIINAYNVCKNGESSFVEPKSPFKINLMLVGGYKFSQYSMDRDIGGEKFDGNPRNGSNPAFGLAFDFNIFKKSEKISLFNEILYQSYDFETFVRNEQNPDFYSEYKSFLDVAYIDFTNSVRLNISKTNQFILPFIGFNLTNSFKVKDESYENEYSFFYDSERLDENIPFKGDVKSYSLKFSISLGVTIKNLAIESRYILPSGLSEYPNISSASSFVFLLNYRIL